MTARALVSAGGLLALTVLLSTGAAPASEGDPAYPKGLSTQEHSGLTFQLHLPEDYDPAVKYSLLVALHGMGSSGVEFATWFEPLTSDDFIVLAPKSTGTSWNKPDVENVKRIVRHLLEVLSIDETRLHGTGFSNGGAHLPFLVFDRSLPFATVCWMGSGFSRGGKVPPRAKKEMAVLALAGEKDQAFGAAKQTAALLRKKVRTTEFRSQPDTGHEIPEDLMPYYYYWLKVMEGRCEPGEDLSFDWAFDIEMGREEMAERGVGGFYYFYLQVEEDEAPADVRHLQNSVFFDPLVRHFGNRLVAMMGEVEIDEEEYKRLEISKVPAVVVVSAKGKVTATFEGKVEASALAKAFRAVAADKSPPK